MCQFPPPRSTLVPVFQTIVTEEPATPLLPTRQLLVHLHSSSFCTHFSVSLHSAHRQHIPRRQGCVHQKRLQTEGWLCVKLMLLEYRNPGLFNEGVHLFSIGCVCAVNTRHHHDFCIVDSFAPIASSSVVCAKPVFLKSSSGSPCRPQRHPSTLRSAVLHQIA